jgi:hypothetical protein
MQKIVIIGNGFDLAHGLKTSYRNFVEYIEKTHKEDPKTFSEFYEYRVKKGNGITSISDKIHNSLFQEIVDQTKANWCDIETLYYETLLGTDNPVKLNKEFKEIKSALENYLELQNDKSKPIEGLENLFSRLSGTKYLINFNYTNTYRHYEKYFSEVLNIHGTINNTSNPIIFGYASSEEESFELLERNNDAYIENIKQYEYFNSLVFTKIIKMLSYSDTKNVHIMGHSCGMSDRLILKTILEDKNVDKIYNYYHKSMYSHKAKLINLNRTTNQNVGFKKYVAFPKSLRMPQHDDDFTPEEIDGFFK